MNPYRESFYQKQTSWHGYQGADHVREKHEVRARYYDWFTRDWLPPDKDGPILDIGCGSGQFLYFLQKRGFTNLQGIDLDRQQVALARELGLNVAEAPAIEYLNASSDRYAMVAMLDIIEHFTREELAPIMNTVVEKLRPGGYLLASVPNAESPDGLKCVYADITHEIAFTPGSFEEMLFCHGLKLVHLRDPWPAPISTKRRLYRGFVSTMRGLEGLRLRCLGFEPPRIWSNVMWVLAQKPVS